MYEPVTHPVIVKRLEKALAGEKPGFNAQMRMSPSPRQGIRSIKGGDGDCVKAGVLVLLFPVGKRLHLALTKRTDNLENHGGQISLPGGRQESGERIDETALRETEEELGVRRKNLKMLGKLTPLYVPPSNYCVTPVVAFSRERPDFHPSPREVEAVIELPLEVVRQSDHRKEETWRIRGKAVAVPFYQFRQFKIWGATAMVLSEFGEMVNQIL